MLRAFQWCWGTVKKWHEPQANPSICPSTSITAFLPSYLSLYCIYLFHCLTSLSHSIMFSLAWHRGTGSVTSSLHSLFPLEAAVGCLLVWSEILNLHLAASYKHCWLWNNELWSLSYTTVYLKDRLPVTTLQSVLLVCETVPVFNLSLLWLDFTGINQGCKLLSNSSDVFGSLIKKKPNKKQNMNGQFISHIQLAKNVPQRY